MCPNSILGPHVTPIEYRMSLNSILGIELTAYEPQFDTKYQIARNMYTWYRIGIHMSPNSARYCQNIDILTNERMFFVLGLR